MKHRKQARNGQVFTVNPAVSEAQRRYLNMEFGHEWVKEHGFDNKGPLPDTVEEKPKRKRQKPTANMKHLSPRARMKLIANKKGKKSTQLGAVDPTRTVTMRRAFERKLAAQFAALKGAIVKAVGKDDLFGLVVRQEKIENANPNHDELGRFSSGEGESNRWKQPNSETEAKERFHQVADIHTGKNTFNGEQARVMKLPGGRFINISLGKQWDEGGSFKDYKVRLDFGIEGMGSKHSAETLQPGTVDMMRKLENLAHVFHHAGFKLAVAAADERRRKFYQRAFEKAGFKLEEQDGGEQIWNCNPDQIRGADGRCGHGIGLGISREDMPQIPKEQLDAFVKWLRQQGIGVNEEQASTDEMQPVQSEFRQERVDVIPDSAMRQPVIVAHADGVHRILDGTHRWIRARQNSIPSLPVIALDVPMEEALELMRRFSGAKFAENVYRSFVLNGKVGWFPCDPRQFRLNEVPDERQPNHWTCGASATRGASLYFGWDTGTIDDVARELGTDEEHSTRPEAIAKFFRQREGAIVHQFEDMDVDQLAWWSSQGCLILTPVQDYMGRRSDKASFDYGHYLTVIGVGMGYVFCQDSSLENWERVRGGDVPEGQEQEANIDAPGRIMVREDEWMKVWHDVGVTGKRYVRWGTVIGREGMVGEHANQGPGRVMNANPEGCNQHKSCDGGGEGRALTAVEHREMLEGLPDWVSEEYDLASARMGTVEVETLKPTESDSPWESWSSEAPRGGWERAKVPPVVGSEGEVLDGHHRTADAVSRGDETMPAVLIKKKSATVNFSSQETLNASADENLQAFQEWMSKQLGKRVRGKSQEQLWDAYIKQGFAKGAGRAFDDVKKPHAKGLAFEAPDAAAFRTGKQDFLQSAFGQPVAKEKVQLLASRTFDELENVTDDMSNKMSRILADGMVTGAHPFEVAKGMADQCDMSLDRAKLVSRTELIRAHAEGQLVGLRQLGVKKIGVQVEFLATDGTACPECASLDGAVYDIDDASGLIPVHPGCKCCWRPSVGEMDQDDEEDATENAVVIDVPVDLHWVDNLDGRYDSVANSNPEGCNQHTGPGCSGRLSEESRSFLRGARERLAAFNKLVDRITDKPVLKQVKAASAFSTKLTQRFYGKLAGRYGHTAATAILLSGQAVGWAALGAGAMAGVPLWLPGSSIWGAIPAVAMAEVGLRMVRAGRKLKQGPTENADEQPRDELGRFAGGYSGWVSPTGEHIPLGDVWGGKEQHEATLQRVKGIGSSIEDAVTEHGYSRLKVVRDTEGKMLHIETSAGNLDKMKRWVNQNADPQKLNAVHYTVHRSTGEPWQRREELTANSATLSQEQIRQKGLALAKIVHLRYDGWLKSNGDPELIENERSFFADCERDEHGWCVGEGAATHVPEEKLKEVQAKARSKARKNPKPTDEEVAAAKEGLKRLGANLYRKNLVGNSKDRKVRRTKLLEEFGDGKECPCVYCGLKLKEGTLEQDKIHTTAQGGRYRPPNLVPACSTCNKRRGDVPWQKIKWLK